MNVATISTRRLTGLDYRIWLVMVACWVVCAGWFTYKKIAATYTKDCGTFRIMINRQSRDGIVVCEPNVNVLFELDVPRAKVEWDFDDGSAAVKDNRAMHKFTVEGDFKVVATINGGCEYTKMVTVRKPVLTEQTDPVVKIFSDSSKVRAGSRLRFTAVANVPVRSYQWTLLPTNEMQNGEDAIFSFPSVGEFTVQVVINNNPATRQEQKINVADAPQLSLPNSSLGPMPPPNSPPGPWDGQVPPGPKPQTPKPDTSVAKPVPPPENIHETDPETFKGLLQVVLKWEGNKKPEDLYPFLKYGGSTQVEVDGKTPFMSLDEFCNKKRNKKIKKLEFIREKDNPKYIQTIKLELKGIWPF